MLTSSMKKTIFLPAFGWSMFFLNASRLPSIASTRFVVEVFPEKLMKAERRFSGAFIKKFLVMTDFPTPVSPMMRALKPFMRIDCNRNLYLTVSLVGTKISKKFCLGSKQ